MSPRGGSKQNSKKKEVRSGTTSLKLPPITNCGAPHKNCKPFPQTTTQFIGWKSKDPENNLERYGKYTKPTKTFLSEMNWPYEAMVQQTICTQVLLTTPCFKWTQHKDLILENLEMMILCLRTIIESENCNFVILNYIMNLNLHKG